MSKTVRITEIFYSLQGEASNVGFPTAFVRLTGCPLRCQYCDTEYAFKGGRLMSVKEIIQQVDQYHARFVTVTGGEPLAQPGCYPLLTELCNRSYSVSLETSGALDISKVDPRVSVVLDIKTPGSGEVEKNLIANIPLLKNSDQVKFVICDRLDFDWAVAFVARHKLLDQCMTLFSPSYQQLDNQDLAQWILATGLPIRFQLQIHKYIWGDIPGV